MAPMPDCPSSLVSQFDNPELHKNVIKAHNVRVQMANRDRKRERKARRARNAATRTDQ